MTDETTVTPPDNDLAHHQYVIREPDHDDHKPYAGEPGAGKQSMEDRFQQFRPAATKD